MFLFSAYITSLENTPFSPLVSYKGQREDVDLLIYTITSSIFNYDDPTLVLDNGGLVLVKPKPPIVKVYSRRPIIVPN